MSRNCVYFVFDTCVHLDKFRIGSHQYIYIIFTSFVYHIITMDNCSCFCDNFKVDLLLNVSINHEFDSASLWVGIFYVILSSFFLIIYVPTLLIMWTDYKLMSKPVYNILVWNCVSDLLQVLGLGFVAGVMSITSCVVSRPFTRFWGSIISISWLAGGNMDCFVALNRLMSIHSPSLAHKWYGGKKVHVWILFAWTYGLALNAYYVLRKGGVIYDLDLKTWYYSDYPGSTENLVTKIEIAQDYITEPVTFLFCVGIAVKLIRKHRDTSSTQLTQKEKNAIYQVFIICISLMAMNFVYLVLPFMTSSKWARMAGNTLWLTCCGWSPLIMLSFNSTLRQKIRRTLCGITKVNVQRQK